VKVELVDFVREREVSPGTIERYRDRVPEELVEIWKRFGYGTFLGGFLKLVDPDSYVEALSDEIGHVDSVPVITTGMGDLLCIEDGKLNCLFYREDDIEGFGTGLEYLLLSYASDPDDLLNADFRGKPYAQAVKKYGPLAYDECFGYVPLLALGGPRAVKNLQKVKIVEHIALICQVQGAMAH
jgi:hypothetical protein